MAEPASTTQQVHQLIQQSKDIIRRNRESLRRLAQLIEEYKRHG